MCFFFLINLLEKCVVASGCVVATVFFFFCAISTFPLCSYLFFVIFRCQHLQETVRFGPMDKKNEADTQ